MDHDVPIKEFILGPKYNKFSIPGHIYEELLDKRPVGIVKWTEKVQSVIEEPIVPSIMEQETTKPVMDHTIDEGQDIGRRILIRKRENWKDQEG